MPISRRGADGLSGGPSLDQKGEKRDGGVSQASVAGEGRKRKNDDIKCL